MRNAPEKRRAISAWGLFTPPGLFAISFDVVTRAIYLPLSSAVAVAVSACLISDRDRSLSLLQTLYEKLGKHLREYSSPRSHAKAHRDVDLDGKPSNDTNVPAQWLKTVPSVQ